MARFMFCVVLTGLLSISIIAAGADPAKSRTGDPRFSGGLSTTPVVDKNAYQQISPGATRQQQSDFASAKEIFITTARFFADEPLEFVERQRPRPTGSASVVRPTPPPSGPLYNALDCANCHVNHGRGSMVVGYYKSRDRTLPVQLSVPGTDEYGGPRPHPVYGGQIQLGSIAGQPEVKNVRVVQRAVDGVYGDGGKYQLITLDLFVTQPQHGPLGEDTMYSGRFAPPVFGLGLLEVVPENAIRDLADEGDTNDDGISGRVNMVWDHVNRRQALGRFGWKAQHPSLRQQIAASARLDHGLTSSVFPEDDMTEAQRQMLGYAARDPQEIEDDELDRMEFHMRSVAVPVRRGHKDRGVQRGELLFEQIGCAKCHVPKLVTGPHELPYLSEQTIYPYTDLLLHDMGPDLADNRPVFEADGHEWRTPPLWGIGLAETVGEIVLYLHDGRARTLEEAILWHGGEAEKSREDFKKLTKADRDMVLRFLKSL